MLCCVSYACFRLLVRFPLYMGVGIFEQGWGDLPKKDRKINLPTRLLLADVLFHVIFILQRMLKSHCDYGIKSAIGNTNF